MSIGPPIDAKSTVNLTLGQVSGLHLISETPIKSLTAVEWLQNIGGNKPDIIETPSIDKPTIKGDRRSVPPVVGHFEAYMILNEDELADTNLVLGNAKIPGAIRNAFWEINGSTGPIKAALLDNSHIFVGVDASIMDIDDFNGNADDFDGNRYGIKSFSLTGDKGQIEYQQGEYFLNNSVLAAEIITNLKFTDAPLGSSGRIEYMELGKSSPDITDVDLALANPLLIIVDVN